MNEMITTTLRAWTYFDLALVCAWIALECWDFFMERR